jgi:hypothetical protein
MLAGLVLVCLGWKLFAVWRSIPARGPDSADYGVDVPYGPLVFRGFGTVSLVGTGPHHIAVRLPIVPLFVRTLGRDARLIVLAQAVIGAASWGVLAWVLARRFFSSLVGLAVGAAVLVFSMTATVAIWDAAVLSESLSISLLVLLIAASMRVLDQPNPTRIAVAVCLGGLWVFTRDPNAYMLGAAALTVASLVLVGRLPRPAFIVATAWAVLAVAALACQSASPRWELALYDILGDRILTDRSATQEFARAGMPVTPQVLAMRHRTAGQGSRTKPELAQLRRPSRVVRAWSCWTGRAAPDRAGAEVGLVPGYVLGSITGSALPGFEAER